MVLLLLLFIIIFIVSKAKVCECVSFLLFHVLPAGAMLVKFGIELADSMCVRQATFYCGTASLK